MQDYSKVKVGDTVWYSDVNRRGLTEATVTKVGPKLVATSAYKLTFRKDTGRTNDGYSHQTLIVDKELYESEKIADDAFRNLYRKISGQRRAGVTLEDIKEAARCLKIDLE